MLTADVEFKIWYWQQIWNKKLDIDTLKLQLLSSHTLLDPESPETKSYLS